MEPASPAPAPTEPTRPTATGPGGDTTTGPGTPEHPAPAAKMASDEAAGSATPTAAESSPTSAGGATSSAGSALRPDDVADEGDERDAGEERDAGDDEEGNASQRLARGQERSPRDMAMSLAVLIIPIALLLIFYRTVLSGDEPISVDPAPTIQEAQQAKAFPVLVPQGLGDDWHSSSATFTRQPAGATLRLGYVDPDKDPIQLVESSVPADTLLPTELSKKAEPLGNFRSAAGVWRVYQARPGEKALVLADPSRTVIVVGSTDMENLERLATSLG